MNLYLRYKINSRISRCFSIFYQGFLSVSLSLLVPLKLKIRRNFHLSPAKLILWQKRVFFCRKRKTFFPCACRYISCPSSFSWKWTLCLSAWCLVFFRVSLCLFAVLKVASILVTLADLQRKIAPQLSHSWKTCDLCALLRTLSCFLCWKHLLDDFKSIWKL